MSRQHVVDGLTLVTAALIALGAATDSFMLLVGGVITITIAIGISAAGEQHSEDL